MKKIIILAAVFLLLGCQTPPQKATKPSEYISIAAPITSEVDLTYRADKHEFTLIKDLSWFYDSAPEKKVLQTMTIQGVCRAEWDESKYLLWTILVTSIEIETNHSIKKTFSENAPLMKAQATTDQFGNILKEPRITSPSIDPEKNKVFATAARTAAEVLLKDILLTPQLVKGPIKAKEPIFTQKSKQGLNSDLQYILEGQSLYNGTPVYSTRLSDSTMNKETGAVYSFQGHTLLNKQTGHPVFIKNSFSVRSEKQGLKGKGKIIYTTRTI